MDRDSGAEEIGAVARGLLRNRDSLIVAEGFDAIQSRAVDALSAIASRLLSTSENFINSLALKDPAYEATLLSLRAILESWSAEALWDLIDAESVRGPLRGPALTAHFIASNTSLLAWTSPAKALLMGSASLIRLPSSAPRIALWTEEFLAQLNTVDPRLHDLIAPAAWPSGQDSATRSLCEAADSILVYGSDRTVARIRALTPDQKRFLGFGHRVSFGVVLADADMAAAASDQALDIALFDQQGCLSPHCLFVEGDAASRSRYAEGLADALDAARKLLPERPPADAARIREQTFIACLTPGTVVRQAADLRWTVIDSADPAFEIAGAPGLVYVKPLNWNELKRSLARQGLSAKLQGASIAAQRGESYAGAARFLERMGVCYLCKPGRLQRPPFWWREDGHAVLAALG